MKLAKYKKAIVAAIGAIVVIMNQTTGLGIDPDAMNGNVENIIDSLVAILVMLGVYQVRNADA